MSRFTPQDVIRIPARTAEDVLALHSRLLIAARAAGAPAELMQVLEEATGDAERLRAQILARSVAPGLDGKVAQLADRSLDAAWSGFRDWLGGWVKLGDAVPHASEMRELYTLLFGQGLGFLVERYDLQWAQSHARLDLLRSGRHAELVRSVGGGAMLDALLAAHEAYGRALGTGGERPAPVDTKVREARDELLGSLREYVATVVGTVRRRRPETGALAEKLLQPLLEWRAPSARGGQGEEPPGPGDEPPPAS